MTSLRSVGLALLVSGSVVGCGASARSARAPNDEITLRAPEPDEDSDAARSPAARSSPPAPRPHHETRSSGLDP